MKLDELYLQEAMSIADVDFKKDAEKDGRDWIVRTNVGGVDYEIRLYPARSTPAIAAGADGDKLWALQFRKSKKKDIVQKALRKPASPATVDDYKMQNLNNGQEFRLLPLVMGYLADFIKHAKPDAFMFAADRSEESRVSLYRTIVKRYSKELDRLGYRLMGEKEARDPDDPSELIPFIFIRKDLEPDDD